MSVTIRVYENQREAVNRVAQGLGEGKTVMDAMEYLLNLHQQHAQEESWEEVPHVKEIQYHLSRIVSITAAQGLAAKDQQQQAQEEYTALQQKVEAKNLQLFEAHQQIGELQKEVERLREETAKEIAVIREESTEKVAKAEREVAQTRELLDASRAAEAATAKLLQLAEEAERRERDRADKLQSAVDQVAAIKSKLDESESKLKVYSGEIDRLESLIAQQQKEHEKELLRQKEQAELEKDKAVLQAEKAAVAELKHLQDALSQERERNAQLTVQLAGKTKRPPSEN
ncbi:hypothetical protein [Brevibacillus parabrevis]|uniref:Uncharacterized protein n=1 Tax=Brevibacillus parabrevis TaxID=54914 RepID=A0A4Y3PQW7_BREPA|nr:hypothetical protein [Brevibacillus parabrevis]RNB94452.1 hypothetical protein EDM60_18880 [Brevibacillus parabrevis]GEB35325.1 hypothetical protein BPA01_49050 [Brevibacillus parabrevis]